MAAPYFTSEELSALAEIPQTPATDSSAGGQIQFATDKLRELHFSLHRRMRDQSWDIHPHWEKNHLISTRSASHNAPSIRGLTLTYLRSREQAQMVERMVGREGAGSAIALESTRHPVIEVRVMPEHIAVELIISPSAWWDQRNMIGKLSVARHRETLRTLIHRMKGDYHFGFWEGEAYNEQNLTNRQLLRGNVLDEWMSTFADGQDWLRVGAWLTPGDTALETDNIVNELLGHVSTLYSLYTYALWTSNNNFHSFYRGHVPPRPSRGREI